MTSDKSDSKKKAMLEALELSLGIVTTAAQKANIHRSTHYEWMRTDPEYRNAVKDIENIVLDFGESRLHQLIKSGSAPATIFFLKTRGKARGYVEGLEVTNYTPDKPPVWFNGDEIKK